MAPRTRHPRDSFVTVYGRKAVLEILDDRRIQIDKLLVSREARGPIVAQIEAAARDRGITPVRASARDVTRLSRNARQDQGVVADVAQPTMDDLQSALAAGDVRGPLMVLDGVTTPANVGMIIRTTAAAGLSLVLPRHGCPELGPLVVKASAGTAFFASILRAPDVVTALRCLAEGGFRCIGLAASGEYSPWTMDFPANTAFVLGSEATGMSHVVRAALHDTMAIPMASGVESLNVATACAIVSYEACRRGLTAVGSGRSAGGGV